jgi:putative secretion ATPase (PEP-CTERM system associated)
MYLDYFGFKDYPFQLKPDCHFLFLSKGHARAKAYMDFTIWNRDSFVVITGEIGSGKTTLIQKLISELDKDVMVATISQTQLDEVEFLQAILVEFGLKAFSAKKVELLYLLNTFLAEQYELDKRVVLIVDEAQNLDRRVLEEIRLLSGMETRKENMLNIILVGQPELRSVLNSPGLEQLVQRVRLRFHLTGMSKQEMRAYIEHRLKVAGLDDTSLFPARHMSLLYSYTAGIPRLVNILCDTILIDAYSEGSEKITIKTIRAALEELQWQPRLELPLETRKKTRRTRNVTDGSNRPASQEKAEPQVKTSDAKTGLSFIDTINSLDMDLDLAGKDDEVK